MGASCADDLLAYAMRAMEAESPWRRRPRRSNELTTPCWKSNWRRHVSGSRNSRGVVSGLELEVYADAE